jgi:small subunit ribosomal protein S2
MERMPGALFVIDQRREINAVREARKVGIPVVCLLDTDSDPDLVDIPIPGNDDAMRAIELIVQELCEGMAAGLGLRDKAAAEGEQAAPPRRRSRRATARAGEAVSAEAEAAEPAPAEPPQAEQAQA